MCMCDVMMKQMIAIFRSIASAFAIFFCIGAFSAAQAQSLPAGDFSALKQDGLAEVSAVIDPRTVQLKDGRIVRLTGLDFPDDSIDAPGQLAVTALEVLRDMLEGQSVYLYLTKDKDNGRVNRMGHVLAQLERQSDKVWVQGALISLGLARMKTSQRNPEMAAQMAGLEQNARTQKLGIWAENGFAVLTPEQAALQKDSFEIVEGKVVGVSLKQNRIYINFGADWRSDFTVSIPPGDRRAFSKAGLDPLQWNGRVLRVRGWLEQYNGPYIEIDHPEAIEFPEETEKQAAAMQEQQALPEADEGSMVKIIQSIR